MKGDLSIMNSTVTEILRKYGAGELTVEEANKQLKEAGSNVYLNPNKTGNAWMDDGLGGETLTVENGKVVGGGIADDYTIYYEGKEWHTNGDGETLVAGPGIPEVMPTEKLPEKADMSRKPENANSVVRQKTKRGTYDIYYDELGYAVKATRVR